jgi:NitT/TauT family transport system ATP-binding protein
LQIQVEGVSARFHSEPNSDLHALGPLDLAIPAGQFVCVIGPSGSGKSTLVRVLAGLQAPSSGQVRLAGQPLQGPSLRVSVMFQRANLLPWRTVIDNIALPLEIAGVPRGARRARAEGLLPHLGLTGFGQHYPHALSGGMAQRVALGRVIVQDPDVLLLDEPFGSLDAMTREQISEDLLRVWSQRRQTVVMVTHDIAEAVLLADRVIVFSARPGQIRGDIPITLPRPRNSDMLYTPDSIALARQIRAVLRTSTPPEGE